MSLVGDIRAGLRANIKANIPDWQVSRYVLANPTPPGIQIIPGEIRFSQAMGQGSVEYDFRIQAFVADTDQAKQVQLDSLMAASGDGSLTAAIESDPFLGGVAEDVYVGSMTGYQFLVTGDNRALLISDWNVTVHVNGSTNGVAAGATYDGGVYG